MLMVGIWKGFVLGAMFAVDIGNMLAMRREVC